MTLACPIIPRIDTWLDEVVKPAAMLYFGVPVVDIKAGSYSCRPRNNQRGAKISEHAFGNAMDVMGFVLADGREIIVVKGWRGEPAEQEFLREVFVGACRYFTTVLGPGADPFHYDHIHIDLARHDPRGERGICKPILKFAPRLDGGGRSRPILRPVAPGDGAAGRSRNRRGPTRRKPSHSARQPARPAATAQALAPPQTYRPPPRSRSRPRRCLRGGPSCRRSGPRSSPPRRCPSRSAASRPIYRRAPPAAVPAGPQPVPLAPRPPPLGHSPKWLNGHGLY